MPGLFGLQRVEAGDVPLFCNRLREIKEYVF